MALYARAAQAEAIALEAVLRAKARQSGHDFEWYMATLDDVPEDDWRAIVAAGEAGEQAGAKLLARGAQAWGRIVRGLTAAGGSEAEFHRVTAPIHG